MSYVLGVHGELPRQLGRELWNKPVAGLLVTAGLVVLVANTVDLTGIRLLQKFGLGTPTGGNREVGAVAAGKDHDGP